MAIDSRQTQLGDAEEQVAQVMGGQFVFSC